MYAAVSPVGTLVLKSSKKTCIDNKIFQLHTIITPALCITMATLYSFKELLGDPIVCMLHDKESTDRKVAVESYCWAASTYSVISYFDADKVNQGVYPGIKQLTSSDEVQYHNYYILIPFHFLFLTILFYIPRYIWKWCERGLMRMLMQKLWNPMEKDSKTDELKRLANYLSESWGYHGLYALWFFFCEVANFLFTIGGFFFTDKLLSYRYASYGNDVVQHWYSGGVDEWGRSVPSPMLVVFPRLTKCHFSYYGPSGNVVPLDYLCILSLNHFSDKVFLFFWFYLILLAAISALNLVVRTLVFLSPRVRALILRWKVYRCGVLLKNNIVTKLSESSADWFVLDQLGKNIDPIAFADLICLIGEIWEPNKNA